jgi:hypothetical protein
MNNKPTLEEIQYAINVLTTYLELKVKMRDWHGVRDAACEIEALEAQRKLLV